MGIPEVAEPPPRVRGPGRVRTAIRPRPAPPAAEPPADVRGTSRLPLPAPPAFELPADVCTLDGFHRWLEADGCPPGYRVTFLRGRLLFEPTMEELFGHNRLKFALTTAFGVFEAETESGTGFADQARFNNPAAGVSAEPDVMFVRDETLEAGRVTLDTVSERTGKVLLVTGSPDLVVELLSDSSVGKDTVDLRAGYLAAGVREYWLIDARRDPFTFDLLCAADGADGWAEAAADADGFRRSPVLGRRVRLDRTERPVGGPRWHLRLEV